MTPELEILHCGPGRRSDGVILLTVGNSARAIRKISDHEAVIAIDRAAFADREICLG